MVIFLTNFLALLIKMDASEEGNREALGGILVAVNVFLILAVLSTSWFATQQMVDDSREEESALTLAKTMLTFEERSPGASAPRERRPHRVHPGGDTPRATAGITIRATAAGTPRGGAAHAPRSPAANAPRRSSASTPRRSAASTPRRSAATTPRRSAATTPRGGDVSAATVEALWKEGQAAGAPSRSFGC